MERGETMNKAEAIKQEQIFTPALQRWLQTGAIIGSLLAAVWYAGTSLERRFVSIEMIQLQQTRELQQIREWQERMVSNQDRAIGIMSEIEKSQHPTAKGQ
jgi:hypothetical protein